MTLSTVVLALGCARVEGSFDETIDALGVTTLDANLDAGDFRYFGAETTVFDVEGVSWGSASNKGKATKKRDANVWDLEVIGDLFSIETTSTFAQAGVDLDIVGPWLIHSEIEAPGESVDVEGTQGDLVVHSSGIDTQNVASDYVEMIAGSGGIRAELLPVGDIGRYYIEGSGGDVTVWLPWGHEYDIQVEGDPDYVLEIADLGMTGEVFDGAFYAGIGGRGLFIVDIVATDGEVHLLQY